MYVHTCSSSNHQRVLKTKVFTTKDPGMLTILLIISVPIIVPLYMPQVSK